MAIREYLRCVCGWNRPPKALGIQADGTFKPVYPFTTSLRVDTIGGRGRLTVERIPMPLYIAQGLRAALRAALEQVEADIVEAGGTLADDEQA